MNKPITATIPSGLGSTINLGQIASPSPESSSNYPVSGPSATPTTRDEGQIAQGGSLRTRDGMEGETTALAKPTVPEVHALYRRNGVGCCLHILLDDGNVKDDHVKFCLEQAKREQHSDCIALAEKLLRMSRTQRRKLYRAKHG